MTSNQVAKPSPPPVLNQLRGIPTRHIWDFYHDKYSETGDYEKRLTLMQEQIDNWKTFMQVYNNYPYTKLRVRDSVHFFKYMVKPVWEDPRNNQGGAWIIRVPKFNRQGLENKDQGGDLVLQLFEQVVFAAAGEQFVKVIQPHDDLCGVSFSRRWNYSVVMIWTRRADCEETKQGIKTVLSKVLTENLKGLLQDETNCYYKRHNEQKGFDRQLAETRATGIGKSHHNGAEK
ncbi:MAG: hypothetical protein Q9163_004087 [Psora crenata]